MAMGINVSSSELERMASELKCPICLSLYKQAASLSCNHCFCTSCIIQSMKRISCCPVCKVPAAPREVRPAPQMDSLVNILKGMETSADVSLFHTQQPSQINCSEIGEDRAKRKQLERKAPKTRGRKNKVQISNNVPLSEIVNISPPKRRRRGKSDEVVCPVNTRKRAGYGMGHGTDRSIPIHGDVPTKKKVRGSQLPLVPEAADEADQSKVKSVSSEHHGVTTVPTSIPEVVSADAEAISPSVNQGYDKLLRVDSGNEGGLAFPEKEGQDLVPHTCFLNLDNASAQLPRLPPFFWLRDQVLPSQDEPASLLTQTQGAGHPLRPSFSELKDSDDDDDESDDVQHPDHEVAGNEHPEADSYNSDAFVWSQRPCSAELCSSPPEKQFLQRLHFQPKSLENDEESLLPGRDKTSLHEVEEDDESRSSPKCPIGASEEVTATQTPRLRQEPSRTVRGTLSKCSNLRSETSGGKVCGRLKPNDHSSIERQQGRKSLPKLVGPNRAIRKMAQEPEGNVSTNSPSETEIRVEINFGSTSDDVAVDITGQHCRQQEGFNNREGTPECHRNDISGGDTGSMPDEEDRPSCVFCGLAGDSEVAGPVVEYKDTFPSMGQTRIKTVHVHKLCAEWAPDVYFNKGEPRNLACEVTRGQKIKCTSCGIRGAALGCCFKRCKRSFHYPCGRATPGCTWDEDDFVMFCPQHADCKFPTRKRCRVSPCRGPALLIAEKDQVGKDGTGGTSIGERWPANPACKWVLCGSGLDSQMKGQLATFASVTGASMMKTWSPSVTHVITGTDEHGSARRTFKFLIGILHGKWILKAEWMSACLSAGHIVSEDEYEVTSDINGFRGGPSRSRALIAARGPKLLEGLLFYFFGEFVSVSKEDLQSLIVAGRGVVLHRKPRPFDGTLSRRNRAVPITQTGDTIVLYDHSEGDGRNTTTVFEEAKSFAANAGAVAVPHNWLMDSVASCELRPTS